MFRSLFVKKEKSTPQIEIYTSEQHHGSLLLVVPFGTDLTELKGAAAQVDSYAPWTRQTAGDFDDLISPGDQSRVGRELSVYGASIINAIQTH